MTWIADAGFADLAAWAALVLTGLVTGLSGAHWREPARRVSRVTEALVLACAAAAVVAWCSQAGTLMASSDGNKLLTAAVPIDVAAGFRLAVLWATPSGAMLTVATVLLVWVALRAASASDLRYVSLASAVAFIALLGSTWNSPAAGVVATAIPPFVQSPSAALAPLFALMAVPCLVIAGFSSLLDNTDHRRRSLLYASWILATAAVVSEQVARSHLGIGPRDAVVFGSASSGLVLWLVTSALIHRRTQAILFRWRLPSATVSGFRMAGHVAHAGAACLVASFAAHAFASRTTITIAPGSSTTVRDVFGGSWNLAHQGLSRFDVGGANIVALAIETRTPAGRLTLVTPEAREHHGRSGQHLTNYVALRKSTGGPVQRIRVLLASADSLEVATVRVTFLPLPILWPIGVVLIGLSAMLSFIGYSRSSSLSSRVS